jgi:hypothetical protein
MREASHSEQSDSDEYQSYTDAERLRPEVRQAIEVWQGRPYRAGDEDDYYIVLQRAHDSGVDVDLNMFREPEPGSPPSRYRDSAPPDEALPE